MSTLSEPGPLLNLADVSFARDGRNIIEQVSLELRPKEIVTVIGPNGAGKSTLVKIVLGLLTPTTGRVQSTKNLRFGYVPQRLSVSATMPMKVGRFLSLAQVSKAHRNEALSILSIRHLLGRQLHQLSGGELQRVLLARAISRKPDILVLDEPLQGVDVLGQIELYRLIASLRDTLDCAILMVSHDLHLVMAQTDSVICLNHHVCCHGKPESVSQHPEYLKLFGHQAAQDIAIYQHHHDHHHDIHGDPIDCDEGCKHA